MPISHKYNAIFIHVPKTGGQSISHMMGLRQHVNVDRNYWGAIRGLCLTHLTIGQMRMQMDMSEYYIFAFVRDPYSRILSEYNWRMRNRAAFQEPTGTLMSFNDYCDLLYGKWDNLMNDPDMTNVKITNIQHIRPQSDYIDDSVDIYRFEGFADECRRLQARLGMSGKIPVLNVARYDTQHDDHTIEITNMLYKEDFKRFGYETK